MGTIAENVAEARRRIAAAALACSPAQGDSYRERLYPYVAGQCGTTPQAVEKAIRTWNGGPRYSVRATERYYQKVLRRMR